MAKHAKERTTNEVNLAIDFRISGYVNELVSRLHKEFPAREWSGMAKVVRKNGYYIMEDIRFAEQENTPGNTEMTKAGIATLVESLFEEDPRSLNDYCCWIHSHHSMGCFWSGTDDAQKGSFNDGNTKFFFSVVTAYSGANIDYKCALDIYKPVNLSFDIPVTVEDFDQEEFYKKTVVEYELMNKEVAKLEKIRDQKLALLDREGVVNEQNVVDVIAIMNIADTDEHRNVVIDLLQEQNAEAAQRIRDIYIKEFADNKEETIAFFQGDVFEKRIKELKDCIVVPSYRGMPGGDLAEHNRKIVEAAKKARGHSDTPLRDDLPTKKEEEEEDTDSWTDSDWDDYMKEHKRKAKYGRGDDY